MPHGIARPHPHKMKQLMHEDAGKFVASAIESNAALTQKRAGMDGAAPVAQSRRGLNAGQSAFERELPQGPARPQLVTIL